MKQQLRQWFQYVFIWTLLVCFVAAVLAFTNWAVTPPPRNPPPPVLLECPHCHQKLDLHATAYYEF